MKSFNSHNVPSNRSSSRWPWWCVLGVALLTLIIVLRPRHRESAVVPEVAIEDAVTSKASAPARRAARKLWSRPSPNSVPERSAEEVVAEKVSRFVRDRETLVAGMAGHYRTEVPEEVQRFFAALQAGRWEESTNLFASLQQYRQGTNGMPGFEKLWPAIVETYGVAEAAQNWPAQQLLDYGHAILGSLRPDMVYLGGNDAGRYIPTLLTETGEGDAHIVLTQNALADQTYLEYVRYRFGDRLNALTADDSQAGFRSYIADAQKRLQHDQAFPDVPCQVRPGEDIRVTEGRVQVSGQVAVMAINEQLVKTLLEKNPSLSFALEESFPLESFYAGATLLGPVTELRAEATPLTPEMAAQSVDYWRGATATLLADSATTDVSRHAYARLILGQANLLQDRQYTSEALQAYQFANQLSPAEPAVVFSYVNLLLGQNHLSEARQVVQTAMDLAPDNAQFRNLFDHLSTK